LLWVLGQVKRGTINIPAPSGSEEAAVEIVDAKSKIQPEIRRGNIMVRIQINTDGNLQDILAPQGLTDLDKMNEKLHELEKLEAGVIRQEIQAAWKKAQRLNADIFGFGEAVHRRYPRQWKFMEPKWKWLFPRITLTIKVNCDLNHVGEISEPEIPLPKK